MKLFRSSTSFIGLDLGSRSIKAAQLQRCRTGWRLRAAVVLPRAAEQTMAQTVERIAGVLERQGFVGDRLVLAAPVRKLECEMLDLPPRTSGAPIEQIARAELGRAIKSEESRFEMGCWDIPAASRSNGTGMIALALRHEDADALVTPLEAYGLQTMAIDAQGCALHRACRGLCSGEQACAILDLGWSAASLHIANQQNIFYQRTLWDGGTDHLHYVLVAEHGLTEDAAEMTLRAHPEADDTPVPPSWLPALIRRYADQLCTELQASLAFARQRFPGVKHYQLLLTGGGAALPGLAEMMGKRLAMPVSTVTAQQIADFSVCSSAERLSPLLLTAVGLALYGEEDR